MTTIDRIQSLSDERALEAISLLAGRLFGATPEDEILADVARLTLIASAEESPEDVEAAINAVGQRAFILEAITIGTLALGALSLILTRGRARTTKKTDIVIALDGKVTIKQEETTEYVKVGDIVTPSLRAVVSAVTGGGSTSGG